MTGDTHRFAIGSHRCLAINDGHHTYAPPHFPPPSVFLFADAPPEELSEALSARGSSAEEWKEWTTPYTCLVIDTGETKVLVDTGTGGLVPGTGHLVERMRGEGIEPTDIDVVVVTHGHPDHVGGCVDAEGNPTFPNARYVVSKREFSFWTSAEAEQVIDEHVREILIGTARRNLEPLRDRLDLPTEETEVAPGVRVIPAYGHTPGHLVVEVRSGDEQLLFLSDTVLHPVHLSCPHFCGVVDVLPEEVGRTRRAMLARAARDECLVLAFHFPFPGLGRIVGEDGAWQWRAE